MWSPLFSTFWRSRLYFWEVGLYEEIWWLLLRKCHYWCWALSWENMKKEWHLFVAGMSLKLLSLKYESWFSKLIKWTRWENIPNWISSWSKVGNQVRVKFWEYWVFQYNAMLLIISPYTKMMKRVFLKYNILYIMACSQENKIFSFMMYHVIIPIWIGCWNKSGKSRLFGHICLKHLD